MNCQSLYEQFKLKQFQEKQIQNNEMNRIHNMCNQPKINMNSSSILLKRIMEILDQFQDEELINLQSSIPILQAVGILQVLHSVSQAKQKLSEANETQHSRLRNETQFLYFLWNLMDEEEVQCRQLKQIIQILHSKKKNEVKFIFLQMYSDQDKVEQFVRSWVVLSANQQYYKYAGKLSAFSSNESNKENTLTHPLSTTNYMNKLDRSGELGSPIYENSKSQSKIPNLTNTNQFYANQFAYTCQLSSDQEKQLVDRLYKNDIYKTREEQMKEREQQREKQALKQCTFKPNIMKRGRSANPKSHSQIKGYEKAINRMKAGNEKNKISKQMRDYKPIGENYDKIKQKGINPPKFLDRKKKEEQKILFIISFDLGRHKMNVKIKQSDTQDSVAERICKIYSLKKQFYDEIKQIVHTQLEAYYQEQQGKQNTEYF